MSENLNINNNANLNNNNMNLNNNANANVNLNNEVEAHASNILRPLRINSNALNVVVVNADDGPETEAHRFLPGASDPENEAHALLALTFPPDAPPQRFEVRYTPPRNAGDDAEVVLHMLPNN